jgi:hypothetical protein
VPNASWKGKEKVCEEIVAHLFGALKKTIIIELNKIFS